VSWGALTAGGRAPSVSPCRRQAGLSPLVGRESSALRANFDPPPSPRQQLLVGRRPVHISMSRCVLRCGPSFRRPPRAWLAACAAGDHARREHLPSRQSPQPGSCSANGSAPWPAPVVIQYHQGRLTQPHATVSLLAGAPQRRGRLVAPIGRISFMMETVWFLDLETQVGAPVQVPRPLSGASALAHLGPSSAANWPVSACTSDGYAGATDRSERRSRACVNRRFPLSVTQGGRLSRVCIVGGGPGPTAKGPSAAGVLVYRPSQGLSCNRPTCPDAANCPSCPARAGSPSRRHFELPSVLAPRTAKRHVPLARCAFTLPRTP